MADFRVIRPHVGDKAYEVGDIRSGELSDLGHLIGKCLEPVANKAAPAVQNKAVKRKAD